MKKINIEDFFTEDNEVSGVWFQPKIRGELCGLEFLVTGRDTDKNIAAGERYDKILAEIKDINDPVERAKKSKEAEAKRVAEFIKGLRVAPGFEISLGGKPIEYSIPVVEKIFLKSPLIKEEIMKFVADTANFIKRENNV